MIQTKVDVCNLAMGKLGAPVVVDIDYPTNPAERILKRAFQHYCDLELRKRPWRFALETALLTPIEQVLTGQRKPYQFELPVSPLCLRPVRQDGDTWDVVGRRLRDHGSAPITLLYISRPDDFSLYDPGFCEVLACRLAFELCEPITQSSSKKADVNEQYKDAVREAGKVNAFMTEAESVSDHDGAFSWVSERFSHG